MKTILAGADDSAVARGALAWAADVAGRAGFDLVAARVFVSPQFELPPEHDAELHDQRQRDELVVWCRDLPNGAAPTEYLLLDGNPSEELLDAARDRHADLLVVGSRGAGGFLHLHLGSVAHHLVHHTTIPLAIVPSSGARPVEHIVIGVDGSKENETAVHVCADLAAGLGVGVTAVYAFEPLAEWVPESDPRSWRRRAEGEVRGWTSPIEQFGVRIEVVVDRDVHPVAAIARMLDAHPGSAAIVGARGRGGFAGLRLGRVPLQLVHHTGAAVIIVPSLAHE